MGNIFECEPSKKPGEDNKSLDYLSSEEQTLIREYFQATWIVEKCTWDFSKVMANDDPLVAASIVTYLAQKNIQTLPKFEKFIIDSVRVSPTQSLQTLWEIAKTASITSSTITNFCYLLIAMGIEPGQSYDDDGLYVTVRKTMAEHIKDFYLFEFRHRDPTFVFTPETELEDLINILNKYSPCAYKCFQTFIAYRFLNAQKSNSFRPFVPIHLSVNSDIISPTALVPLSLYTDELQGNWKRLYSTSCDGISYNRILHMILGYEVKFERKKLKKMISFERLCVFLLGSNLFNHSLCQSRTDNLWCLVS